MENSMKAQEAIVKRINGLCKKHLISINRLATLSGMNPSTLKNIVYGHTRNTGIETVAKICNGLDITVADFFDDDVFRDVDQEMD